MPVSSSTLAIWLASEARRRLLRLTSALQELEPTAEPGERAVLQSARALLGEKLREYQGDLSRVLPRTATIDPRALSSVAVSGLSQLNDEYLRLFPFISPGRRLPEDIAFYVARAMQLSPATRAHRRMFNLVYGRYVDWTSRTFGGADGVTAVIPVALTETRTPLRWPLFAHELAHWRRPRGEPLERVIPILKERLGHDLLPPELALFEELFADRASLTVCGPAYVYAQATEALVSLAGRRRHRPDGPGVIYRLEILDALGGSLALALAPWRAELGMASGVDARTASAIADEVQDLGAKIRRATPQLWGGATTPRTDFVAAATRLQGNHEMCAAAPIECDVEAVLATDRFKDAAIELPCTDAEILQAAWELELEQSDADLFDALRSALARTDSTEDQAGELERADATLARSLEVAAIHRILCHFDEPLKPRIAPYSAVVDLREVALDEVKDGTDLSRAAPESSPLADEQIVRRLRTPVASRRLVVRPLIDPGQIGGTTIDLRLGTHWHVLRTARFQALDPADEAAVVADLHASAADEYRVTIGEHQDVVLHPGELLLALTLEYLRLPPDLWGLLEGRSTWARLGLQVHATAGMIDCGFRGYITLELQNTGRLPLVLYPGLRVGQLAVFPVAGVRKPYTQKAGAAYVDQRSARTAFVSQHEHEALVRYLAWERDNDLEREPAGDEVNPSAVGGTDTQHPGDRPAPTEG